MINKKILIVGDSWGCGEWSKRGSISHRGLQNYLSRNDYDVHNVSTPLSSTMELAKQIKTHRKVVNPDYIIAFVPVPFRHGYEGFWLESNVWQDYVDRDREAVHNALFKIYKASNGVPVILLGALLKLYNEWIVNYDNMQIAIPSIIEFADPNATHFDIWVVDWCKDVPYSISTEVVDNVFHNLKLWDDARYVTSIYSDYAHPNRKVHRKIYNHLISNNYIT